VSVDAPDLDDDRKPTGTTHHVARDEGLRDTSLEVLGNSSRSPARTACTPPQSSQISDGAAAGC